MATLAAFTAGDIAETLRCCETLRQSLKEIDAILAAVNARLAALKALKTHGHSF